MTNALNKINARPRINAGVRIKRRVYEARVLNKRPPAFNRENTVYRFSQTCTCHNFKSRVITISFQTDEGLSIS